MPLDYRNVAFSNIIVTILAFCISISYYFTADAGVARWEVGMGIVISSHSMHRISSSVSRLRHRAIKDARGVVTESSFNIIALQINDRYGERQGSVKRTSWNGNPSEYLIERSPSSLPFKYVFQINCIFLSAKSTILQSRRFSNSAFSCASTRPLPHSRYLTLHYAYFISVCVR